MSGGVGDELVLASGVSFFSEDFQALPKVVEILLTRTSKSQVMMEDLKSDLLAVDHALSLLLFNSTQATDDLLTASMSLVALGQDIESNKAELRDVHRRISNAIATLSGKRRDLNSSAFRKLQIESGLYMLEKLEQCLVAKSPSELALAQEVCNKHGFQIELQTSNTSLELKSQIFALFKHSNGMREMKLLLQDLFQVDPEQHKHMVEEIESFVSSSRARTDGFCAKHAVLNRFANNELKFISMFPAMPQCERVVSTISGMIEWGDWVMQLRPLLPNLIADAFVESRVMEMLHKMFEDSEDELLTGSVPYYTATGSVWEEKESVEKPSAYFLCLIAEELVEFAQRHGFHKVLAYLKHVYSTQLLDTVRSEAKLTACSLDTASQCYDSFHSLRGLAKELDMMVFITLQCIGSDNYVMMNVFDPFLQLVLEELDVAQDDVNAIKQDPLYQAMIRSSSSSSSNGGKDATAVVANRELLVEAAWEYFQSSESVNSTREIKLIAESKIPVLVALHNCFSTQEDLKHWGDLALFRARDGLRLLVEQDLHSVAGLDLLVRQTMFTLEFWAQSSAVLDFIFLPMLFRICGEYANRTDLTLEDLFWLQSAFQNEVVEALVFACKLRKCEPKKKAFWRRKLEQSSCVRFLYSAQQIEEMSG